MSKLVVIFFHIQQTHNHFITSLMTRMSNWVQYFKQDLFLIYGGKLSRENARD